MQFFHKYRKVTNLYCVRRNLFSKIWEKFVRFNNEKKKQKKPKNEKGKNGRH